MIRRIWGVTLTVTDLKSAVHFYENLLGLQKKYEFKDYAGFDCGGIEIGLKTYGELEKPRKGEPCIDFLVDTINESYRFLKERGVNFIQEPRDMQWGGRTAVFLDTDENLLQLVQIDWKEYFAVCATQ